MDKTDTGGTIFKIKRFSVHDGPGIRTTVFLKGCPLNCVWCHSPEGINSDISIWHDNNLCISCGQCIQACPNSALQINKKSDSVIKIDRAQCTLSGNCVNVCPTGAIQFTGFEIDIKDVMSEIEKDILYYKKSGGGVTLTGGEPLFQTDFSTSILKACKTINIHTALETCLFCERKTINLFLDLVDLFIIDLKIFDTAKHIKYTGKSNDIIKENLIHLANSGKDILVRIPMIKGITDTEENLNAIDTFVHEINKLIPIEYISYNPLAENNYKRLGIPFKITSP